jgi:flavin reductase (DIM6/NTAB) family NADH-FMN oxidoreductase RutF
MELDFNQLSPVERYKFLTAVVVPRPIAWVTTLDESGRVNAAPFSFFNAMGTQPAIVALGIGSRGKGVLKDTLANVEKTGEFVVNMVAYSAREEMNRTAADFPPETSEVGAVGLETVASNIVKPPRLVLAPVSMECRNSTIVEVGRNRLLIGEVLHAHIDDEYFDPEKFYVAAEKLDLIGRMHGRGWYARTTDLFELPRVGTDGKPD